MPSRNGFNRPPDELESGAMTRVGKLLAACLAIGLLGGCAAYTLGPTNGLEAGSKSVRIEPFTNQTLEPRIGEDVTTALRRRIQKDGTYRLSTHGDPDVIVSGVLTFYTRHGLSFVPRDVLTVRDFGVSLRAEVTARDADTGKVLWQHSVMGHTMIRVGSDLTSAERQAHPLLADDLARKVTEMLVDGSW
jgi:hypothetical protein